MTDNNTQVQTSVQQIDLDIDTWLGAPGADSIVTAAEPEKPRANIFSNQAADMSFLDKVDENTDLVDVSHETSSTLSKEEAASFLDNIDDQDAAKSKGGRPKTEKSGLVEFLKKRIESKEMFAFDDFDESKQDLSEYLSNLSEKDTDDLWQANIDNVKKEIASKAPELFFESLPEELQHAAKYARDGGQDMKGFFLALAQVEQIRELDPGNENDQESIIRQYMQARGDSSEEIDDELSTIKDLGNMEKKAKQFKPKLDQMQEEMVMAQLADQENRKQLRDQAAEAYVQNVFEALRPAEINGLKLDKKMQASLYSGLVQTNYPSISGRPTNQLGHLLEKYQFVEPNYPLIAEALWLLSSPEEYRSSLSRQGKNAAVEQTVRQLKTEQSRKNVSSFEQEDDQRTRKIARPQNIFKR